jgi:hypothetical protein
MDKYTELYAWIWKAFGRESFSIDQFRSTFPTSQGPKVIHDLVKKGYLRRVSRGVYQAIEPDEFVEKISEVEADYGLLKSAGKDYAFCDNTAVSLWTDGYYWTGFTRGFKPVNVAVRKKDLDFWKNFFKRTGIKYALPGESRTLYGQVYVLHPRGNLDYTEKEELKVVPLDEVVSFCLKHTLAYEPALGYLEKRYRIGYR